MRILTLTVILTACGTSPAPPAPPPPPDLDAHCDRAIGPPRVESLTPRVRVAIGYDLANTILVRGDDGYLVVDAAMSPERAAPMKAALLEGWPDLPVTHLVYTHSHADHTGGASVWTTPDTQVWATETLADRYFEQYGTFFRAETARARRQFGAHLPPGAIPCSAIGRVPDVDAALSTGFVPPTHTFEGMATLDVAGVSVQLHAAPGETPDQLFVWLADDQMLLPGDNWYRAFPNLYTIRGTRARPVDAWIASLDAMRRLDPAWLVPSHTTPVRNREAVRMALTAHRDAIQWVQDTVVHGAMSGRSTDHLVAETSLPPHLASNPDLAELYGQVDWSVRSWHGHEVGWFDGTPEDLYPLPPTDQARRTVDAMGGPEAVREAAIAAARKDEVRWALHLLRLRHDAGWGTDEDDALRIELLQTLAGTVANTNGRAWLLEAAHELRKGAGHLPTPTLSDAFVDGLPLRVLFTNLAARLKRDRALDVHERVDLVFTDEQTRWVVVVRRGVAEVVQGEPLPGSPEPLATATTTASTWRRLALEQQTPLAAIASGGLSIEGDALGFKRFLDRFERGLGGPAPPLP